MLGVRLQIGEEPGQVEVHRGFCTSAIVEIRLDGPNADCMDAFVLMLREGVEAALIVGILLAFLNRLGRDEERRWVWVGTWAAVLVSLVAGALVFSTIGSLDGRDEEIAEGLWLWRRRVCSPG